MEETQIGNMNQIKRKREGGMQDPLMDLQGEKKKVKLDKEDGQKHGLPQYPTTVPQTRNNNGNTSRNVQQNGQQQIQQQQQNNNNTYTNYQMGYAQQQQQNPNGTNTLGLYGQTQQGFGGHIMSTDLAAMIPYVQQQQAQANNNNNTNGLSNNNNNSNSNNSNSNNSNNSSSNMDNTSMMQQQQQLMPMNNNMTNSLLTQMNPNIFVQRPQQVGNNSMYMYYQTNMVPQSQQAQQAQQTQQQQQHSQTQNGMSDYNRQNFMFSTNPMYPQQGLQLNHTNTNNNSALSNANTQGIINMHPNLTMMNLMNTGTNPQLGPQLTSNMNQNMGIMNMPGVSFNKMQGDQQQQSTTSATTNQQSQQPTTAESGHPVKKSSSKKKKKKSKYEKKTGSHRLGMEQPRYDTYLQEDKLDQRYPITELAESLGFKKRETKTWRYRDLKRFLMKNAKMKPEHEDYIKTHHPDISKRLPHKMTIVEFIKRMALLVFHFIVRDGKEPLFWTKINSNVKDNVFNDFLFNHDLAFYNMINRFVAKNAHSYIKKGYTVANAIQLAQEQYSPSNKSANFATTSVTGGLTANTMRKSNGNSSSQNRNGFQLGVPPPPNLTPFGSTGMAHNTNLTTQQLSPNQQHHFTQ